MKKGVLGSVSVYLYQFSVYSPTELLQRSKVKEPTKQMYVLRTGTRFLGSQLKIVSIVIQWNRDPSAQKKREGGGAQLVTAVVDLCPVILFSSGC